MTGRRSFDYAEILTVARETMLIGETAKRIGCTKPHVRHILATEAPDLLAEISKIYHENACAPICCSCEKRNAVAEFSPFCSAPCRDRGPSRVPASGLARYEKVYLGRLQGLSWEKACCIAGIDARSFRGAPRRVKIWGARKNIDVAAAFGFVGDDS